MPCWFVWAVILIHIMWCPTAYICSSVDTFPCHYKELSRIVSHCLFSIFLSVNLSVVTFSSFPPVIIWKKKHYDCLLYSKWTIWVYNFFFAPIASYPFFDLILYYHILMLITFLKTLSNSFYNWLMREALTYQERQCVSVWTRAEKKPTKLTAQIITFV